jgi:hypothetical protein
MLHAPEQRERALCGGDVFEQGADGRDIEFVRRSEAGL